MKFSTDTHQRILSAYELLQEGSISVSSFENIRALIRGIHPEIDKKLAICSKALQTVQKVQSGDIIQLSAEHLPEDTEEKKKRKKALLFFISSIKDLQSEIKRIDKEFSQHSNSIQGNAASWGRIVGFAKGPLGLITLVAVIIVLGIFVLGHKKNSSPVTRTSISPTPSGNKVEVITFNGKQIPLSQLHIGHPHLPNCDSQHYHANNGYVTALDGTIILDPGNCGFGKVQETQITTVFVTPTPTAGAIPTTHPF